MYDLADGYDSWLERLDALNAEQHEPEPTFDPWTNERLDETEQEYFDRCPENDTATTEWYQPEDAEQPEPAPQTVNRARAYVRPADDKARLATSIRDASRRYPHRSHRHQAGEES